MLPKDFSTNILIPAIVWLVFSVLITVGIISPIKDERFATLLFLVICVAIFIIPMIIYLNCRTLINNYFDGKKKKQTIENTQLTLAAHSNETAHAAEDVNEMTESNTECTPETNPSTATEDHEPHAEINAEEYETTGQTNTNWPTLFADNKALVLFDGLVKENLLAEGYQKKEGTKATQLAYMLSTIYEILNITPHWQEFELFWNVKNLRQTSDQTFRRKTVVKNQYAIKLAIQKAADSDFAIRNMEKYIKWRKNNAID